MKQRPSLAANLRGVGTVALLLAPGFIVLAIRSGTRWVAFCLLFIVVCRLLFWILAPYSSTARKEWKPGDEWDPGNPENRERTRLLRGQLRARLLAWDPIGIANTPEAQDEYDCLLSPLMHHLHGGSTEDELDAWLTRELEEHFGLSTDPVRERQLAASLVAWWATSTGP